MNLNDDHMHNSIAEGRLIPGFRSTRVSIRILFVGEDLSSGSLAPIQRARGTYRNFFRFIYARIRNAIQSSETVAYHLGLDWATVRLKFSR